jgi:hypothetical protein
MTGVTVYERFPTVAGRRPKRWVGLLGPAPRDALAESFDDAGIAPYLHDEPAADPHLPEGVVAGLLPHAEIAPAADLSIAHHGPIVPVPAGKEQAHPGRNFAMPDMTKGRGRGRADAHRAAQSG